jgi:predicted P-loop ATPase
MSHLVNFIRNFNDIEDELDITEVFAKIKNGEFEAEISRLRYALSVNDPEAKIIKSRLLGFTPAGVFNEKRNSEALVKYSGLLHVDIDKITNEEMLKITTVLKNDNSVFAFFISPSGNGLKVFFKINDTAENHSKNSSLLFDLFEKKYGIKTDQNIKDIPRLCFVSDDPNLYLNESSIPIMLNNNRLKDNKLEILELQTQKSFKIKFEIGQRHPYLLKFASVCRNNGVSEDILKEYCIQKFKQDGFEINEISSIISNAYKNNYYEDKTKRFRNGNKREKIEEALMALEYKFRYNVVKKRIEISTNENVWLDVDDRFENDIIRILESNGFSLSHTILRTSLNSSFAIDYNPFIEYLAKLPPWDGEDYIMSLFQTLNTTDELFYYLEKWLVSLVASILDFNVQNQTVLLLIGSQGIGKSRWLNKLIPSSLKEYSVQGIFDPKDKDTKIFMSENLIGNLDELDSIDRKDIPRFKEIITSPGTKVRAPFARNASVFIRRISFCGSVNSLDFLQDYTGSRRFLCIEMNNQINHQHTINIDMVYSQALALYRNGYKPYFTMEESEVVQERNKKFRAYSLEEELITEFFESDETIPSKLRMSTLDIILEFEKILGENNKIRFNQSKLGKILTGLGYNKVKTNGIFKYCMKKKGGRV